LKKVKNFFPGCKGFANKDEFFADIKNQEKCNEKLKEAEQKILELRKMKINEAAEELSKIKPSMNDYWYWYYILANVALRGHINSSGEAETWFFKDSSEITVPEDTFINKAAEEEVQKLEIKSAEFIKKIKICKQKTLFDLKQKINPTKNIKLREWIGDDRNSMELRDFDHNLEFVKLTTETSFYKTISEKLPKGVIHHFHWSAAHTSENIYQAIINYLKLSTSKKSIIAKVNIFKPDRTEQKLNKNTHSKKFSSVSSPKIYIFKDFEDTIIKYYNNNSDNFSKIRKNLIEKETGKCYELVSQSPIFEEFKEKEDEIYLAYLLFCKNSYIYLDEDEDRKNMINKNASFLDSLDKIQGMKELKKFLDQHTNILKSNNDLLEAYLPDSYKNKIKNIKELLSVSVWYLFENIFNLISSLFSIDSIFEELNRKITDTWKNQNVLGVEYRQKPKPKLLDVMIKHLNNNNILYAFQHPGVKIRGRSQNGLKGFLYQNDDEYKLNRQLGSNLAKDLNFQKKIPKERHYSGIDFFGYEDEPFNGARNFFVLSLQKILKEY